MKDFYAVAPVHSQERREILGLKIVITAGFLGLSLCTFCAVQMSNPEYPNTQLVQADEIRATPVVSSGMEPPRFKVLSSAMGLGYFASGNREKVSHSVHHDLYQAAEAEDDTDQGYPAQTMQVPANAYPQSYPPAQYSAPPQYAPNQYSSAPRPASQYLQTPPAQGYAQIEYNPSTPVQPGEMLCRPCACSSSPSASGCYRQTPGSSGYICDCPSAVQSTPPPAPEVGSQEWKDLPGNKYGDDNGLAITAQDTTDGVLTAGYESGQVAYQLSRYLKQHAKAAKIEEEVKDIILKDLYSVQPCKLVPGGPGGYRCANSEDDEGDAAEQQAGTAPSASEAGPGGKAKNGVLGLGFLGLKSTPVKAQALSQSQSKSPPLTLEQARKLETQIAVLREDAWALPSSIQADLEELRHATQRYEAAQDKGSLGLGINILGLKI